MQDIFIRNLLKITGSQTDPKLLVGVLPGFANGQIIRQIGRGSRSNITCGQISRVFLLDPTRREVTIECCRLYERRRPSSENPGGSWIVISDIDKPMVFPFTWFRLPNKETPKHPVPKLKLEDTESNSRCWLCPDTDPMHLELFRLSLLSMVCAETFENRTLRTIMRRLRVRLLH